MNSLLLEKLLDLLVNILAIVLSGGFFLYIIESRRHKREQQLWQREDELIAIDIPRSDMVIKKWIASEYAGDKIKVLIYENKLEGTVKELIVITEFVIRNTTAAELIITKYDAEILNIPAGNDTNNYYDLETHDYIVTSEIGAIKLKPYSAIPRFLVITCRFNKNRVLENPPSTLVISATTSSGKVVQGKAVLKATNIIPDDIVGLEDEYISTKYLAKMEQEEEDNRHELEVDNMLPPEDDIPF